MASIFPSFVDEVKAIEQNKNNTLPVAKEIAIDFSTGNPIIKNGDFVVVEKNEAIKVWCYYALKIAKGRFLAFTNNYGSELEEKIIGKQYNSDTQKQVKKIVEDCLLVNKYRNRTYNSISERSDCRICLLNTTKVNEKY